MRKWWPPDVAASHEWKVIYQIVVYTIGVSTRYFEFSSWDPFDWPFGYQQDL